MKLRAIPSLLLATALAILASGCGESQLPQATGKGGVRGINGVVDFRSVNFLIEERTIGDVSYKTSTNRTQYDDLEYTFNFELPQPNANPDRVGSRNLDVIADNDYTFVLAGDATNQQVLLWERPVREWTDADTVFEVNVGHAHPGIGSIDVYIAADGTVPVAGNAIGTLDFGAHLEAREFESGEYQVTITPAGDPATILLRSAATQITPGDSYLLALFEADPGITGPASLRIFRASGTAGELADERFPPTVQFVNASLDTGAVDIAVDGDYANLAVSNLGFGEVSGDVEIDATTANYQYAPAGTTMAVLDEDATIGNGSRNLFVLVGDTGEQATIQLASVRRGFSNVARLRIINAVTNVGAVDVYIRAPGTNIEEAFPNIFSVQLGFTTLVEQLAGDYEVTITETGSKTPLAGPTPLTLNTTDVVELVLLDAVDPNALDTLIYSNVNP